MGCIAITAYFTLEDVAFGFRKVFGMRWAIALTAYCKGVYVDGERTASDVWRCWEMRGLRRNH